MPRPYIPRDPNAPSPGTPTSQSDAAINAARVSCERHGTEHHPMTRCPDCKREHHAHELHEQAAAR